MESLADIIAIDAEASLPHLPRALRVRFTKRRVVFVLSNGGELSFPLHCFPTLAAASPAQRAEWKLRWDGAAIRWASIDEDVSIRVLLTGPC